MNKKNGIWESTAFYAVLCLFFEQLSMLYMNDTFFMKCIYLAAGMIACPAILFYYGHKLSRGKKQGSHNARYLVRVIYCYLLAAVLQFAARSLCGGRERFAALASDFMIQVIFCMVLFSALAMILDQLPPALMLLVGLAAALFADAIPVLGTIFGLKAFMSLLFFFVLGYYAERLQIKPEVQRKEITTASYLLLAAYIAFIFFGTKLMTPLSASFVSTGLENDITGIGPMVLVNAIRLAAALVCILAVLYGPAATLPFGQKMGENSLLAILLLPAVTQLMTHKAYVSILQQVTIAHWRLLFLLTILLLAIASMSYTAGVFVKLLMFPLSRRKSRSRFVTLFQNMIKYRFLLMELIKKGIVLKYRRSLLGILWSLLEPLLTMMVLTYVFGGFFGKNDPLYGVYVLTGRLMFTLFSNTTSQALRSIRANSTMIKKVYVPKYMYPMSSILFNFVLFLISLIDLALVMVYYRVPITIHLLEAIIPILMLLLFSIGVGMILSTINVFFRDIEYLWNVFTLLLMYCSAVFYQAKTLAETSAGWLLKVNPVYLLIYNLRRTIIYGQGLEYSSMMVAAGFSVVFLFVGFSVFYKKQDEFILHI